MRPVAKARLAVGIWLIETLMTMQFSIIITASNDLVADKAPTGLVLFAYSIPSILTRIIVPFVRFPDGSNFQIVSLFTRRGGLDLDGDGIRESTSLTTEVNYPLRLVICAISSFLGLQILALFDKIGILVLGVMLAALSSNLCDMSLQMLCARYPHGSKYAFGGYTVGSGSAALLGASLYTFSTSRLGMKPANTFAIVGLAPIAALLTYVFILPDPEGDAPVTTEEVKEGIVRLPWRDKLRIIKPMFIPYMFPLASIFFIENSISQGIFPTLLFYLPIQSKSFLLTDVFNRVFRESREFYPLYLTVNQLSSFVGRFSFWLFRLPGGQTRSTKPYWTLVMIEGSAFLLQLANSSNMTSNIESSPDDPEKAVLYGPMGVVVLAGVQGMMAGVVFCNTYWKVMDKQLPPAVYDALDEAKARNELRDRAYRGDTENREETIGFLDGSTNAADKVGEGVRSQSQETALREFLLSTIAPPDVISVTIASLFGMALQQSLCKWQGANGRELCMKASN